MATIETKTCIIKRRRNKRFSKYRTINYTFLPESKRESEGKSYWGYFFVYLLFFIAFVIFLIAGCSFIVTMTPASVEEKLENSTELLDDLQKGIEMILSEDGNIVKLEHKIDNIIKKIGTLEGRMNSITNKFSCLGCERCHKTGGGGGN